MRTPWIPRARLRYTALMTRARWRLLVWIDLAALIACAPKPGAETESSSGSGASSSASTSGGVTSGGGGCEAFLDQEVEGPSVTVTIENLRDAPAFVAAGPACTSEPLLELAGPGGSMLHFREVVCDYTCADQFSGMCQCAADCALAPVIRIEPGGKYSQLWSGGLLVAVTAPTECVAEGCSPACSRREQAPAGGYTFSTAVGSGAAPCIDTPALCACEANADGWCPLFGLEGVTLEGLAPLEAAFTYPGETQAALLIE